MINSSGQFLTLKVWILLVSFILVDAVSAHPLSVSYSRFTVVQEGMDAVYRLPMDDMDLLFQLDKNLDDTVSQEELESARDELETYLDEQIDLMVDGVALKARLLGVSIIQNSSGEPYLQANVIYQTELPVNQLEVSVNILTHLYPNHRNLAEFEVGSSREEYVFQHGNTWSGELEFTSFWRTARVFMQLGIEHIFTGYDHILFLLGLLLVGRSARNLVAVVTSFTIAHSLTLALATLGVIQPVDWIVEAAIALSIVYVGMENLLVKEIHNRWRLTFVFGLVHGLGFAGVLQQMDLEIGGLILGLFAFNLGVEIGQLAIIAICWPLLHQLAKSPYRNFIIHLVSIVILGFGVLWFIERVL